MTDERTLFKALNKIHGNDSKLVEADIQWQLRPHQYILTPEHQYYPTLLKEINKPPSLLYVRGNIYALNTSQIALVGSRNPTPSGRDIARQFSTKLAQASLCITSGLALGIDTEAHQGALAANGLTVGVLGNGLDLIYPRRNQALANTILEQNGALISEFPRTTPPLAKNFPRRNRIISGLSLATLVIEASLQSGSLITARLAMEQNRDVYAVPGSIHNPVAKGCHTLIKQGAQLIDCIEDVIESLPNWRSEQFITDHAEDQSPERQKLEKQEKKLLECIGFELTSIDQVIERSGFSTATVRSMLCNIEIKGYIRAIAGRVERVK